MLPKTNYSVNLFNKLTCFADILFPSGYGLLPTSFRRKDEKDQFMTFGLMLLGLMQ